jgi:hypothetical protein
MFKATANGALAFALKAPVFALERKWDSES